MSKLEVDAIEPQSGTTLTIGASGDSVNIASGATITDFTSTGIDDNATSTAITIDSSEQVGIGTASPVSKLTVDAGNVNGGGAKITSSNQNTYFIIDNTGTGGAEWTLASSSSGSGFGTGSLAFASEGTERMRIDSSGNVLVGTTSIFSGAGISPLVTITKSAGSGLGINSIGASQVGLATRPSANHNYYAGFFLNNAGTGIGNITVGTSSTSYNTSSDYRLKENVFYDFDATTRLKQLRPARFNFIADADTTVDGFLAHEVSSIVPEAITGEKDANETKEKVVVNANGQVIAENIEQADWEAGKIADENGNTQYPTDSTWEATKVVPVYQGIDQSKLVPLLVKTIQELEARITALETSSNS